ncbi:MAG: WYL domain-containing protein [Desulfobulbaceae bacterium]|nr:WYL domain-containing protein [Desulfobulbaceae bacterium]
MALDKTQLLRHIFIDKKIREGMQSQKLANCSTMAKEYEVSPKSILRDIDFLRNQRDAPIAYDSRKKGYYYTEENYSIPAISINESDLFAICIAEKALTQYENTPIYKKLVSVFQKIEQSLPEKISITPAWIDTRLSVIQERQTRIDPAVWETVAKALKDNRTLHIHYLKPGRKGPTARDIDPYHVVSFKGEWYLIGHCHLRKKVLTFAISRIKNAKTLRKKFTAEKEFDFEKFSSDQFGIFRGEGNYTVAIEFSSEHAPYVLERKWGPSQAVKKKADGNVVLSFQCSHLYEVKRWILSWGKGVRVLSPEELKNDIRAELKTMTEAHNM